MDVIACGIEADDAALAKFSLQNIVHVVTKSLTCWHVENENQRRFLVIELHCSD